MMTNYLSMLILKLKHVNKRGPSLLMWLWCIFSLKHTGDHLFLIYLITYWGLNKTAAILQTTFLQMHFLVWNFSYFDSNFSHWHLFLRVKLTKRQCWGTSLALTHVPLDKMAAFLQMIFSAAFSSMKSFVFWLKFKGCSLGSNWQYGSIGSDNSLAPNWQQAIILTNADLIHWHIYAVLGGD